MTRAHRTVCQPEKVDTDLRRVRRVWPSLPESDELFAGLVTQRQQFESHTGLSWRC